MAQRKSNFDLEAQRPITSHKVDKPNDTWCLIGGIIVLIGLCAGSLYMIQQMSGGGAGITELCNSYTKRQEAGKGSKFERILGKAAQAGYTSIDRVTKETIPFLETFVRHFQNNVNAFGSFTSATMKFACRVDGLKFNESVFIEGNSAGEFLEALATKSQALSAKHVKMILNSKASNARTLYECLQALAAGDGIMAMFQNATQEQAQAPVVVAFKKKNPFEQREYLNGLIDTDYYASVFGAQGAAQLKQFWPMLWIGEGHGMQPNPQILDILVKPSEGGEVQKPGTGGLLLEAAFISLEKAKQAKKGEVPLIAWVEPKSVTLEITRGLIPQSTMIWQNGPVNGAQPTKADE